MLLTVDQNTFKHCGQIQIRKISRINNAKVELENLLQTFNSRFGRIAKLLMVHGSRKNNNTDATIIAFLQYEPSASHYEATRHFTFENLLTFCGKTLKFIPAGFTNSDRFWI